ncbi:MAG: hypothetical protein HY870_22495 [Chloroflexi bacterium]|nr:hypothetical protein [Chloroflexota bacterium]
MLKRGLISGGVISLLAAVLIVVSAPTGDVVASAVSKPTAVCDVVSCTVYLPLILKPLPVLTPVFELTQGVQQPDNSVRLIAQRPGVLRWSLTAPSAVTNVSGYLMATRNGETLAGSPLAATNNPRTLKSTVDRTVLNDTFNFQLPTGWADGTVNFSAYATNTSGFMTTTSALAFNFSTSAVMQVKVVPIAYQCTSGGTGTTTPTGPYDYLVDYTFRAYPVPSIALTTHTPIPFSGPCLNGVPKPWSNSDPNNFTTWSNMLNTVTGVWQAEGSPNIYYYGLLHLDCGSGCVAGIGWLGLHAAVGFDGFGAAHSGASDTHAHEVGHNHNRYHAPGCGAGNPSSFPYLDGSNRAIIGNAANPNYGFDLKSNAIYTYGSYFDFMTYCDPGWVSDFTYEALWQFDNVAQAARPTPIGDRSFLIRGAIDPGTSRVEFKPTYTLDIPARLPIRGDYVLELLDTRSNVIATYPFEAASATPDRYDAAPTPEISGFHLSVPYVDNVSALRVRRGSVVFGSQRADSIVPTVNAAQVRSGQLSWSGVAGARYLVRASLNNGRTWEVVGFDLDQANMNLAATRLSGQPAQFEIVASRGLNSQTLKLGPVFVPEQ